MNSIQLHPVVDYSAGIAQSSSFLLMVVAALFIAGYDYKNNEEHRVLSLSVLIVSAIIGIVLLGTSISFIVKQTTQTNEVNTHNMNEFSKYSMIISKDKDANNCADGLPTSCRSDVIKDAISNPQQRTTLEFPAVNEKTGASVNVRIVIGDDYKLRLFTQQGSNDSTWKIVEPSSK